MIVNSAFSMETAYLQSLRGLLRLHALSEAGEDESPAADAVRESLEYPWYALSEVEKERINGLSEDLYSISENSDQSLPMNPQAQRNLLEAENACRAGEWDRALALLRRWGKHLSPAELAFYRGDVWRKSGADEAATIFYRRAAQLEPSSVRFNFMYMSSLFKIDADAAFRRAAAILERDDEHSPIVVAQAAYIHLIAVRQTSGPDHTPEFVRVIRALERALLRLETEKSRLAQAFQLAHSSITSLLGYCHGCLGDLQEALRYCDLGLAADPYSATLLVTRGILGYGAEARSVADFEQAINSGATIIWPFFFLAHHCLVNKQFEKCRRMCERALECSGSNSDEVRANLNEWLAISGAELGFAPSLVRSAFEEAIRLAPDVDRIRENFELYQKVANEKITRDVVWGSPSNSIVRAMGREAGPLLIADESQLAA